MPIKGQFLEGEREAQLAQSARKLTLQTELLSMAMNDTQEGVRYWSDFSHPQDPKFGFSGLPERIADTFDAVLRDNAIAFERKSESGHFSISVKDMQHTELNALGMKLEGASAGLDKIMAAAIGSGQRERLRKDLLVKKVTAVLNAAHLNELYDLLPASDVNGAMEVMNRAVQKTDIMAAIKKTSEQIGAGEKTWTDSIQERPMVVTQLLLGNGQGIAQNSNGAIRFPW